MRSRTFGVKSIYICVTKIMIRLFWMDVYFLSISISMSKFSYPRNIYIYATCVTELGVSCLRQIKIILNLILEG